MTDAYTAEPIAGERQWPAGPLGLVETPTPIAIGFCPRCGANARQTAAVRGIFDCPRCVHAWYDLRVGQHPYCFDDFFGEVP